MRRSTSRSVHAYMVVLTLAIVLPMLGFSGFLVIRAAEREQAAMTRQVSEQAQATAVAIDQMLAAMRGRLFSLATSPPLANGDLGTFHTQLRDLFQVQGLTAVLTDATGRSVFATSEPFGVPLPDFPDTARLRQIADRGLPATSGLVISPLTHGPAVLVSIPVVISGHATYMISVDLMNALANVLMRQRLPDSWMASVIDRDGYIIARNREPERFVGRLGRIDAVKRVQASNSGSFPYTSLEGVPVENAFTHVSQSGWAVVIGIPRATLLAPVRQSTAILILLGIFSLAITLILAMVFGRHISQPIAYLVDLAQIVGQGGHIASTVTGLRETDFVAVSLHEASERLAQSAAERHQASEDLRQSGERYRALAEELALSNRDRQTLLQLTVQGQEDERRRIARELHDGLGQYLTALRLGLTAMERCCHPGSDAPRQLASLKALTGELGQALGRMAWEIRPTALDDLGLQKAIAQYLEEWAERCDLQIDQEVRIGRTRLDPAIETTLFRVVQEAVTNVAKHAGADRIAVILDSDGAEVRLIIEDNGRGFPADDGGLERRGTHQLGLVGIRERLALVKGTLELESMTGQGTTLYVRVPLPLAVT